MSLTYSKWNKYQIVCFIGLHFKQYHFLVASICKGKYSQRGNLLSPVNLTTGNKLNRTVSPYGCIGNTFVWVYKWQRKEVTYSK